MSVNVDYKGFGKRIKALRLAKRITQQTVCDVIGISCTHYSNIENGIAKPSLDVLVSIANYFNISLSDTLTPSAPSHHVPYEIKSLFDDLNNKDAIKILDILSYTKKHLYQ